MTVAQASHSSPTSPTSPTSTGARSGEIILVAFLATVTMLFAGFTAAFLIRRTGADWEAVRLPGILWANTAVLALSSIAAELACRRARRAWLSLALLLGVVFLAGQFVAWRQLAGAGVFVPTSPHGSFFFVLTAVHALHLLGGVGALVYARAKSASPRLAASYWHFMGLVWLYVLALLQVS